MEVLFPIQSLKDHASGDMGHGRKLILLMQMVPVSEDI